MCACFREREGERKGERGEREGRKRITGVGPIIKQHQSQSLKIQVFELFMVGQGNTAVQSRDEDTTHVAGERGSE